MSPYLQKSVGLLCLLPLLASCSTLGYYSQAVGGHLSILSKSRPVEELIDDEREPAELRARLRLSQEIRAFGVAEMGLPDNGSYRHYADLGRPYALWNVIATREFSVEPEQWCFLMVGCLSYRGYFSKEEAQEYAETLRRQGFDVHVAGAQAYSTLGWMSDPLLNTFMKRPEEELVGLIIHEMAHQKLYVAGDSAFNEAFAVAVALEGVRRWCETRREAGLYQRYAEDQQRYEQLQRLLFVLRERLQGIYASGLGPDQMRESKREAFARFRDEYAEAKKGWGGYDGFDGWVNQDLNNAHLALLATYREFVPAFSRLIARHPGEIGAFYAEAQALGKLPASERHTRLKSVAEQVEPRQLTESELHGG